MGDNETKVIFMDNKYSPNVSVQYVPLIIAQYIPWDVKYYTSYIIPEIQNVKLKDYPFSYEFIA